MSSGLTTIESSGTTTLLTDGTYYYLQVGDGPAVELSYGGSPVTVGQFGAWTFIAAQQTTTGFEVALKNGSADQYGVWDTDANGNFVSGPISNVSGTSLALESIEVSFNHDLNGDGTVGVPVPSGATLIEFVRHHQPADGRDLLLPSNRCRARGRAELWRDARHGRPIRRLGADRGAADGDRL